MPNWKKVIISGSNAALNSLEITSHLTASGLIYPTTDGTDGQAITTDGAGNLIFGNPGLADEAERVTFEVQNGDTSTLAKGTPIHITSTTNGTAIVVAASASVASKMPSHGILNQQLTVSSDGFATILGQITGVDTSAFSSGDTVYVGPFGGYTNVKPTGSTNLIQNLGVVKKVDASNGTGEIFGSGRTNDVPNLPTGKIWVGDSYTVTSSVVHLDESNSRLGINTNTPNQALDVLGSANITGSLIVSGSGVDLTVEGDVIITDGNRLNLKSAGGTYTGYIEKDSYNANVNLGLNTTFTGARRIYINDGTDQRWEFGGNTTGASDNIIAPGGGYSGSAVYAGHAGNIGFFTRGTTVAANVMQLFDRTDNSNHGVKLIYQSGGSYSDGLMLDNTGNVGINNTSPSARLQVKGSGTTSATTTLLAEDSAGTELLKVYDDGITAFGDYTRGAGVQSDDYITTAGRVKAGGGITFRPPTVNDDTWYGFDFSSNFLNVRVGGTTAKFGASGANTNDSFYVSTGFNPSSGTTDKSFVRILSNNQTAAGYSGDVYALKIEHSLGSKSGTGNDYGIHQNNSSAYNYFNGNVGIGNSVPPEKLTVEGNISGSGNLNVDGNFTMAGGTLDTAGGLIDTNGGDIDTNGGNINIGTGALNGTIPGSAVNVDTVTATVKNFVIDHPTPEKEGYKLRHSSLEGPEIGVYFRGKSTESIIHLPDYWKDLVDEDSITVNLTPFGSLCQHYIEDIKDNQVIIGCACGTPNYHFTVYGERKDVEKLVVEYKEETYL